MTVTDEHKECGRYSKIYFKSNVQQNNNNKIAENDSCVTQVSAQASSRGREPDGFSAVGSLAARRKLHFLDLLLFLSGASCFGLRCLISFIYAGRFIYLF